MTEQALGSVELPEDFRDMHGMTPEEFAYAQVFYDAIMAHAVGTERSLQSAEFRIGVSDLGFCSERLRRSILRIAPDETDMLAAWVGTALGDHAEQALVTAFPHLLRQQSVTLDIEIEAGGKPMMFHIPGHPDLIDAGAGILWDAKTDFGLEVIARTGPSDQQQYQRHGYAKAAHAAGLFPHHTLEEIRVGNFWIDRGAVNKRLHVQIEDYDEEWVTRATDWLGEVIYAFLETKAGRETFARKEPPREMCEKVCGHFKSCRLYDTDVEGRITDPVALESLHMYAEGLDFSRNGERLKKVAKAHLDGFSGSSGDYLLRWVWVNGTETQAGYYKIDVRPIKK